MIRLLALTAAVAVLGLTGLDMGRDASRDIDTPYDQYTAYDAPSGSAGGASLTTVFNAPLSSNGITAAEYAPSGFTAPTFLWLASDPTNDQLSAETFTKNGDPTEVDSPWCPSGDFSDLTSGVNCMRAMRFDGTGDSYSNSNDIFELDNDMTLCALVKRDADDTAVNNVYLSKYDNTGGKGWLMRSVSSGAWSAVVNRDVGTIQVSQNTGYKFGEWVLNCLSIDLDGDLILRTNAVGADNEPVPTGDGTNTEDFLIGDGTFSTDTEFQGDIAFVIGWDGTNLSDSQVKEWTWYALGLGTTTGHSVASYTTADSAGSTCWVDGQLVEYSENMPKIGCTTAPLLTETGTETNMAFQADYTNSLTYTRDLSNWTETGTGVVTCSQSETPYLDGRTTCLVADDSASVAEYMSLTISPAMSTNDRYTLCIAARSAEGGDVGIDVAISGATGGACTPWTDNVSARSVDETKWHFITTTVGTVDDGDCTDLTIDIGVVQAGGDFTDVSETGSAYVVPVGFYVGSSASIAVLCPQVFSSENTGSASSFGDDDLSYTISSPVVTAGGAWVDGASMMFDVQYHDDDITRSPVLLNVNDGSTSNYIEVQEIANNTYRLLDNNDFNIITSGARTVTTGTVYTIKATLNYSSDAYELFENDTSLGTASDSLASPSGLTTINVGADDAGAVQSEDTIFIGNVKVVTP